MDSSRAAAKAVLRKLLRRISANLMNAIAAKIAPQRVATDTNVAFYFPARCEGFRLADYLSTSAFINLAGYVTPIPQPLLGPHPG